MFAVGRLGGDRNGDRLLSGSLRLNLVIAIVARSPCEPGTLTGPSRAANSIGVPLRNASFDGREPDVGRVPDRRGRMNRHGGNLFGVNGEVAPRQSLRPCRSNSIERS